MSDDKILNSVPLFTVSLKVDDDMNVMEELLFLPSPFFRQVSEKMPAEFLASMIACPSQYVIDSIPDSEQLQYIKDLARFFRKTIKDGMVETNVYNLEKLDSDEDDDFN